MRRHPRQGSGQCRRPRAEEGSPDVRRRLRERGIHLQEDAGIRSIRHPISDDPRRVHQQAGEPRQGIRHVQGRLEDRRLPRPRGGRRIRHGLLRHAQGRRAALLDTGAHLSEGCDAQEAQGQRPVRSGRLSQGIRLLLRCRRHGSARSGPMAFEGHGRRGPRGPGIRRGRLQPRRPSRSG